MKNEEKLYQAIGEIDEELVKEASCEYKSPLDPALLKGLTVAASITVVFLVTVVGALFVNSPVVPGGNNVSSDSAPSAPDEDYEEGVLTDHAGFGRYLTNLELVDDLVIKFNLSVISETCKPVDIILFGRSYNAEGDVEYALCATSPNPEGYKIVLTPSYTVNGMPSDSLPTVRGEYEITVDFGIIDDYDIVWNDHVTIDGKEGFKIR